MFLLLLCPEELRQITNLKHLLYVVVFVFEQLAPGRQVAVGEDAAGFQQPESVTLKRDRNIDQSFGLSYDTGQKPSGACGVGALETSILSLTQSDCFQSFSI